MPVKAIFVTELTDTWTDAAKGDPVGSLRFDAGNWYKCVKSSGALDFAAGDVVGYVTTTGPAASTVSATISETSDIGAGVSKAAVTVAGVFFWIQLTGVMTIPGLDAGADGNLACLKGATDKQLDVCALVTDTPCAAIVTVGSGIIIGLFPLFGTA